MDRLEAFDAEISGIDQLRAVLASGRRAGIAEALQFDLVEVGDGFAGFSGTPDLHAYNTIGIVHGGYASTLLDSACACAVQTKMSVGQVYVTLELKVAFHRAITKDTGPVRAEGRVLSFGRRAALAEGRLVDGSGKLHATATSSLLVFMR